MTDNTTYGLIGRTLGHSFSQRFFTEKFAREKINASYLNFELPDISLLPEIIAANPSLHGLNVTIPYKEAVIPLLDHIDNTAANIGAVNTIKITPDSLSGYNTDIIGFRDSLLPLLKPYQRHALILGTGGASKAIAAALSELDISFVKVSRTPSPEQLCYSALTKEIIDTHLIIINTTPLGTYPDITSAPPIPYPLLTDKHLCYDLVYNPPLTEFLSRSREQRCTIKNGLEMLQLQAEASWRIWND